MPDVLETIELFLNDLVEQAGRQPERGDCIFLNRLAQLSQRRRPGREDHEPPAVEQWTPDFQGRSVKRNGRELEESFIGVEARKGGLLDQSHDTAMCHTNAFRSAGGAGSIAHIGQVFCGDCWCRADRPAAGDGFPAVVQADDRGNVAGSAGRQRTDQFVHGWPQFFLRQKHRGVGVVQQEGQTLFRIGRVE